MSRMGYVKNAVKCMGVYGSFAAHLFSYAFFGLKVSQFTT
jgi:hypothetical protein